MDRAPIDGPSRTLVAVQILGRDITCFCICIVYSKRTLLFALFCKRFQQSFKLFKTPIQPLLECHIWSREGGKKGEVRERGEKETNDTREKQKYEKFRLI